ALISCPDCGREISDSAPSCPECGRPVKITESKSSTKPGGNWPILVAYACVLIIFLFVIYSIAHKPLPAPQETKRPEQQTKERTEEPIEYKLAVIEAGGAVPKDDPTVARFRSLLTQLSSSYIETPQRIANLTVWAQKELRKEGVQESLPNIMEGMSQV